MSGPSVRFWSLLWVQELNSIGGEAFQSWQSQIAGILQKETGTAENGHGSKPMVPVWDRCTAHFSLFYLLGIGMFTGGTIWIWTHGPMSMPDALLAKGPKGKHCS